MVAPTFAAAAQSIDPNALLLFIALVGVGAAVLAMVTTWGVTRPPKPETGPPSMDLGPETPALVDLLTGGFTVDDDAVPATAVDLASRRWLDIELVTGGHVILRARTGRDELTPYERRVHAHVTKRAVDGVTPAAALTIGPEGVSKRWWKGFVREVNRHGRDLGLCRRRWGWRHVAMLWGPLALGWVLLMAALATADRVDDVGGWGEPGPLLLAGGFVVMAVASEVARRVMSSDAQAETDAGMEAASRWLGVRAHLAETGSFEEAPAASVAIWDRHLAYATAMGLAPVVQRELPFETEHDRHAWSRSTGYWRRVRVRYFSMRPGWGLAPWTAAFTGALQSAFLGLAIWVGVGLARENYDLTSTSQGFQDWMPVVGLGVAAVAGVAAVSTVAKTLLGLSDLFARRTVEGELVRRRELKTGHRLPRPLQWMMWSGHDDHGMRRDQGRRTRYHVAIDDGSDESIVAYQVRPALFRTVRQGARVRARVTPRLGYVTELAETSPPPHVEPVVANEFADDLVARAAGAVIGRLGVLDTTLPDGTSVLDQVGDDGRTGREHLAAAQAQIEDARRSGAIPPTGAADGSSLVGGVLDEMTTALEGLIGSQTGEGRTDDPEPPAAEPEHR